MTSKTSDTQPKTVKTQPKRKVTERNRSPLELTYIHDGSGTYHVPQGKQRVRSSFDSFYLTVGGMYIHTGSPGTILYGMEPLYKGHAPRYLSLRIQIPSGQYTLSQSYLKDMDCLMALYRKGMPEPLWIGRPELSGNLYAELPYMEFVYGEYFVLIANLKPGDSCRHRFRDLNNCWCYDFEFLPNGIYLPHPQDFMYQSMHNNTLVLYLSDYELSPYDRFTALFFDSEYHFMGSVQDIQPKDTFLHFNLPQNYLWTDGEYHVVLQHNLYSFHYFLLSCKDGVITVEDSHFLQEEDPFYRLSVDVTCNESILHRWEELYGCREVKEGLLQFCATHALDDYQHFCITAPEGFVPSPQIFGSLLYDARLYMECNIKTLAERFGTLSLSHVYNLYERDKGPIVLGVTGISYLFTSKGKELASELNSFVSTPNRSLIVCCTEKEAKQLCKQYPVLGTVLMQDNRWKVKVPTLEEYIRMSENIFGLSKVRLSPFASKYMKKLYYRFSEKILGMTRHQVKSMLEQRVIHPFLQQVETMDHVRNVQIDAADFRPLEKSLN